MEQEIADRWADALESGKYKQGKFLLNSPEGFCCLGVLCEIAVEDGVVEKIDPDGSGYTRYHAPGNPNNYDTAFLPDAVVEWAGVGHSNIAFDVDLEGSGGWVTASGLNDTYNYTFAEIAELIRQGKVRS